VNEVQKTKNPRTFWVRGPKSGGFFQTQTAAAPELIRSPRTTSSPTTTTERALLFAVEKLGAHGVRAI
jgi:hypothetical protein